MRLFEATSAERPRGLVTLPRLGVGALALLAAGCGDEDEWIALPVPVPTTADVGVGTFTVARAGAPDSDRDFDGYTVAFGDSVRAMGINDTWTVRGLASGTYQVAVSGIQENCRVDSPGNPVSFQVNAAQDNGNIEFRLSCDHLAGTLTVQTTFQGAAPDPDGYSVVIDGQATGVIGANDGVNYPLVPVGLRTVELRGIASNCVVQGQNPRTTEVLYGQQVFVRFVLDCPAPGTCTLEARPHGGRSPRVVARTQPGTASRGWSSARCRRQTATVRPTVRSPSTDLHRWTWAMSSTASLRLTR
jgi:hypothetical protein